MLAALAMNANTPDGVKPEIARRLVPGAGEGTLRVLAQDQATPEDVLLQLAAHPSSSIRGAVSANKAVTAEILRLLAIRRRSGNPGAGRRLCPIAPGESRDARNRR